MKKIYTPAMTQQSLFILAVLLLSSPLSALASYDRPQLRQQHNVTRTTMATSVGRSPASDAHEQAKQKRTIASSVTLTEDVQQKMEAALLRRKHELHSLMKVAAAHKAESMSLSPPPDIFTRHNFKHDFFVRVSASAEV